jgi:N-acetylglucosamine kinase-like BadF-type ATPase
MSYIMGVDGGGSKTEAIAYDLQGNIVGRGMSGFGNVLIDYGRAMAHIMQAIEQASENLCAEDCLYLYLGLAGIEADTNQKKVVTLLQERFATPVKVVNDAILAYAAFFQEEEEGILTISGTGSISVGKKNNTYLFSGGWGHLLGDEGSGYWIAMEAVRQMIREEDTSSPRSELSQRILEELGFNEVGELKPLIYAATKAEIAALVPLIAACAHKGEPIASHILKQAGHHLGQMTCNLAQKLQLTQKVNVALKGTVLETLPFVQAPFITYVQTRLKKATFIKQAISATKGAYYLAKQEL